MRPYISDLGDTEIVFDTLKNNVRAGLKPALTDSFTFL